MSLTPPEISTIMERESPVFIVGVPHSGSIILYRTLQKHSSFSMELDVADQNLNWLKISPRVFCDKYADYLQLALRENASNEDKFMMIKYENFTSNSQDTFRHIFDFIEEPYEEDCIPEEKNENYDWQGYTPLFSRIKKTTKNWKEFISEEEARFIEDRLDQIMNQLDYPRHT